MLTLTQIQELSDQHALKLSVQYPTFKSGSLTPPKPTRVLVTFEKEAPDAWEAFMTQLTEVPVELFGTRVVSGSGALDGRLMPGYLALLPRVNSERKTMGLSPEVG